MEINDSLVPVVIKEIEQLADEYRANQGMILTEDDLKCQLFARLKPLFPANLPTINKDVFGSAIHTEVKFYDENQELTLIPDITILDTRHLSIFHGVEFGVETTQSSGYGKLPRKEYEAGGNMLIIELKFCRNRNGITDGDHLRFQSDISKIFKLQNIVRQRSNSHNKLYGLFVLFNKTDIGGKKFKQQKKDEEFTPDFNIIYQSGNVDFSERQVRDSDKGYQLERHSWC
ncbi:hypothetical protein [Mucilaginibacter sp. UYCu711]|uniref:hypothetical protein n=1 Tax=Mucilaginibacter sp. UYCu711 TaxID=3156339 RepID=UPI003D22F4FB